MAPGVGEAEHADGRGVAGRLWRIGAFFWERPRMIRRTITPRPDWQALVEAERLVWHSADGRPYWDESACYVFTADQVAEIETASAELYRLFLAAGQAVAQRIFCKLGVQDQVIVDARLPGSIEC